MRKACWVGVLGVALAGWGGMAGLGVGSRASGQIAGAGVDGTGAVTGESVPAEMARLLADLANDDFKIREGAQERLDAVSYEQRDLLKRLADNAMDAEVKVRLMARVEAIDIELATNPPPISVNLKDATLAEVAAALGKATGVTIEAAAPVARAGAAIDRFTLQVDKQPFWEVMSRLCRQHPLSFTSTPTSLRLAVAKGGSGVRDLQAVGSFGVYVTAITRTSSVDPQLPAGQEVSPVSMVIRYTMAADPRMRFTQAAAPQFTQAVDNKGNAMTIRSGGGASSVTGRINFFTRALTIEPPEGVGSWLTTLKGEAKFVVPVEGQVINVESPEKRVNEEIRVGSSALTLRKFEANGATLTVQLVVSRPAGEPRGGGAAVTPSPLQITVVDSTGKHLWNSTIAQGSTSGSVSVPYTGPLTLQISVPVKTKEIVVPLEFKNLPLPQG